MVTDNNENKAVINNKRFESELTVLNQFPFLCCASLVNKSNRIKIIFFVIMQWSFKLAKKP